jgi:hypothetical protein
MKCLIASISACLPLAGYVVGDTTINVIDDQKILKQVPLNVGSLVEKKMTLDWAGLVEQLKRNKVKLELPNVQVSPLENI